MEKKLRERDKGQYNYEGQILEWRRLAGHIDILKHKIPISTNHHS